MNRSTIYLLIGLFTLLAHPPIAVSDSKAQIKKCRDASGRMHYGDSAAAACADSAVTIINKQGVKTGIIDAPLTAVERKEREQKEAQAERAKEQAKRDEILLTTYAVEADIVYIRDRKVAQLESSIKASTDTLNPLRATLKRLDAQAETEKKSGGAVSEQTAKALEQTRSQIAKHEAAIAQRREEEAAIKAQAQQDLERFRELKGKSEKATKSTKR